MRFLIPILFASACATSSAPSKAPASSAAAATVSAATGPAATAVLEPRTGSTISGTATFTPTGDGLAAHVEVGGAQPGQHGVHVHEKGDCNDPKAQSAGGHFNPNTGAHHGGPQTEVRHGGDLGNLTVDDTGKGTLEVTVKDLSVQGPNGVAGRSIVVHEKADDLHSDPAGNSGGRFACGVVQAGR